MVSDRGGGVGTFVSVGCDIHCAHHSDTLYHVHGASVLLRFEC